MHRLSAMDDPDAPIGHHWQDSTTSLLVSPLGPQWRTIKIEGSIFTGREPDEDRYDFDHRILILSADGFRGIQHQTWLCNFHTVT